MIPGVTVKRELDESTGRIATVVIEHKEDLNPQIEVRDAAGKASAAYSIPVGAQMVVSEGDTISPGALLAKTPRQASKTKDITGGLPRVAELFEARRPKDAAEMARIDGVVNFEGSIRGKRRLLVKNEETARRRSTSSRTASTLSCSRATWCTRAASHRWRGRPARDPRDPRAGGAVRLPHLAGAGGLPAARRDDQRQAHRDHHPPDAAQGAHHRSGR